jgi:hypothetical protein
MRNRNVYRDCVLTIIAGLLAWIAVGQVGHPSVFAQSAKSQYVAEVITVNWGSQTYQADFAAAINGAAKGRELIAVLKHDQPGKYLAVYK